MTVMQGRGEGWEGAEWLWGGRCSGRLLSKCDTLSPISSKRNTNVCHSVLHLNSYSLHVDIMPNRQEDLISSQATQGWPAFLVRALLCLLLLRSPETWSSVHTLGGMTTCASLLGSEGLS